MASAYTQLVSLATKKSSLIIADSECSKKDIHHYLGIAKDKIIVVYLAASPAFKPIHNIEKFNHIREKFNLNCPFIMYMGGVDHRKNVPRLLEAFSFFLKREFDLQSINIQLVIAGHIPNPGILFPDVKKIAIDMGLEERVKFIGKVTEEEAAILYNMAELFIFPSIYEGFGLPPLEAMSCGTPVICSNTSSLPEVVGDAAIKINPYETQEIFYALEKTLLDQNLRSMLREKGLKQATKFNWSKTATETIKVYAKILEKSP